MNTASVSSSGVQAKPEFIIYSFEKDLLSKGSPVWSAHKVSHDEDEACRDAAVLFTDTRYTRVEVRRKASDEVIKVYDSRPNALKKMYFMLFGAIVCIAGAGLITLYQ